MYLYYTYCIHCISNFIMKFLGLNECLASHVPQFEAHCITGTDLLKLTRSQLEYLKVSGILI